VVWRLSANRGDGIVCDGRPVVRVPPRGRGTLSTPAPSTTMRSAGCWRLWPTVEGRRAGGQDPVLGQPLGRE